MDARRRVLFVAGRTHLSGDVVPPHGSGAHVASTLNALESSFEITEILAPDAADALPAGGRRRLRRLVPARLRGLRHDLLLLAHDRRLTRRALAAARAARPSAVYERDEYLSFAGLRVARKLRVPYILEVDGLVDADAKTQYRSLAEPLGGLLERRKLQRATTIVVESPGMASALERRGVDRRKLAVVPNAVAPGRVRREPRAVRRDGLVVGWIGHLMPWYVDALAFLVQAAGEVRAAVPGVRFEIVAGGPAIAKVHDVIRAHELAEAFTVRGPVPQTEIPAVLESFDVGVIPALFDYQFPVKLVEMGASGLPVVAPATTSLCGLLAAGEEFEPFEPGDAKALAAALVAVLSNADRRGQLGGALRDAVATRFTWTVVSELLAAVVERATSAQSSSA